MTFIQGYRYIIEMELNFIKKKFIFLSIILFCFSSAGAKWENYKIERVKIADGVILEKKISKNSGKLISEEYKVLIDGNYWDAQFKDGKWVLSMMGQEAYDTFKESGDASGGGGGGCN